MNNISYIPNRINTRIDQILLTINLIDKDTQTYYPYIHEQFKKEFESHIKGKIFTKPGGIGTNFNKYKIFSYSPRHRYITIALYPDESPINYIYDFFIYFKDEYNLEPIHNVISLELAFDLYPFTNNHDTCERILFFIKNYIDINSKYTFFMTHNSSRKQKTSDGAINGKEGFKIFKDKKGNMSIKPEYSKYSTNFNIYPKKENGKWFIRIEGKCKRTDISHFDYDYGKDKLDNLRDYFKFIKSNTFFSDIFCFSKIDYESFVYKVNSYDFKRKIYKYKISRENYIQEFNKLNSYKLNTNSTINDFYKIKKISKIMNLSSINNQASSFKIPIPLDYINHEIAKLDHLS